MQLDTRIALAPMQGVQAQGQAINNAFNTYYKSAGNARQNALLELQEQNQAANQSRNNALLDIQQNQENRAAQNHQMAIDEKLGRDLHLTAQGLKNIVDPMQRSAVLEGLKPKLLGIGMSEADIQNGLDDNELDFVINATSRFAPQSLDQGYFAPTAALDSEGNPVFVQGSKGGGLNKLDGFTPMKQTAQEESKIRINEAQEKAKIDVEKDINKLSGTAKEERILSVIDTGIAAAESLPTYDRMLELIDTISTGGVQAGLQKAKQLFGWGAADIGELDALFKEAVLSNLRKMGANPTEGERQFLLESSGSITQSPAVLKRLISRRRDQSQNAVEKGKKWASERGDNEALDLMSFSQGSQPAQQNEDDAALQWAKSNPNDPRAQRILNMIGGQ